MDMGANADTIQTALERFTRFLKERQLSLTRQRAEVLRVFLETGRHLSAEELAGALKARGEGIGLTTVYRTLKLMVECGLAEERHFSSDVTLYEPELGHHEHLICLECRRIVEFEDEALEAMKRAIAQRHGFAMRHHSLQIFGVCADCQAAAE
jgi:Fur family ferric uptake transcriptional regulator